jgi:hypothetical protein
VRIAGVNKGTFADAALLEAHATSPVDFILCVGDDEDDEYMLSALSARTSHPSMMEKINGNLFTVTVGARVIFPPLAPHLLPRLPYLRCRSRIHSRFFTVGACPAFFTPQLPRFPTILRSQPLLHSHSRCAHS